MVLTAICWPGVIKPGMVISKTTANLNWFSTICAMTSISIPGEATICGRNLTPLLKGEAVAGWDNSFYGKYSTLHQWMTFSILNPALTCIAGKGI